MGKDSKIAWTDHTFNPWWGCAKVSDGCKHCYAETFSNRFGDWWGPEAERRYFGEKHWNQPLKWNREAEEEGIRHKVFCGSMCDIFEYRNDPEWMKLNNARWKLWPLIENTPNLDWLLLSKRPEKAVLLLPELWWHGKNPEKHMPENVWIGTTTENQEQANIRIPKLLHIPARIRWLSIEPMLDFVDLSTWFTPNYNAGIHWVIVGGESGPGARPMQLDWARSIRDQCQDAGVPFFMKQIGGHLNKGKEMKDFPEDLRIREFPKDAP